jgi:hypothetical protein
VALRTPAEAGSGAAGEEQDCRALFFLRQPMVGAESRRRRRFILLRYERWKAADELQHRDAGIARSMLVAQPSSGAGGLVLGARWSSKVRPGCRGVDGLPAPTAAAVVREHADAKLPMLAHEATLSDFAHINYDDEKIKNHRERKTGALDARRVGYRGWVGYGIGIPYPEYKITEYNKYIYIDIYNLQNYTIV